MTESTGSGRLALTRRLEFRLGLGLCVGAAFILAATGTWSLLLQREQLTELVRESGARSVEIIRRSMRDAMLRNHPEEVHELVATIGAQEGIERIRIFDREGRVRVSTDHAEQGTVVRAQARSCGACHQGAPPPESDASCMETTRILARSDRGGRVLAILAPIVNEPDCSTAACHAHPASQHVLGVLDTQLSLDAVDRRLAATEQRMSAALLLTGAGVLLLSGFLVWRMVIRPVRELTRGTERVAAGDLSTQVPVRSADEIGELAHSWNRTVAELGRARTELQAWSTTLERRVEEKTAELETAHQRMLLSAKMASLGKLAAVVAHEINNPLAGINTFARVLRKRAARAESPDPEVDRILALVAGEAQRCGEIVRNLLLFSRAPGARFTVQDLREIAERCLLLVKHQAELAEIELRLEVAPGMPQVACDVSQIQQLILVLAQNAIEAMPAGGSLTLGLRKAGDAAVEIVVTDTGIGIDAADLEHIFEPFYTRKEEGKGVGLGLAVAYGIARRHGGGIDVESKPGVGTTFRVRLPIHPPSPAAAPTENEEVHA